MAIHHELELQLRERWMTLDGKWWRRKQDDGWACRVGQCWDCLVIDIRGNVVIKRCLLIACREIFCTSSGTCISIERGECSQMQTPPPRFIRIKEEVRQQKYNIWREVWSVSLLLPSQHLLLSMLRRPRISVRHLRYITVSIGCVLNDGTPTPTPLR